MKKVSAGYPKDSESQKHLSFIIFGGQYTPMEKIDLHMHSMFSDGTDTPEEIVLKTRKAGIGLIALTDHNTLAGIGPFREACLKYGQTGIDGIELTTRYPEPGLPEEELTEVHVLGYLPQDSDLTGPDFNLLHQVIREYRDSKILHNESMVNKMASAPIGEGRMSVDGFRRFAHSLSPSGNYNRVHIARYMIHLGIVDSIDMAMDNYIGEKAPYYTVRKAIHAHTAIEAIHAAGGTAVIAHLGEYHLGGARLRGFFDYCIEHEIDGFELLHPHNTPKTVGRILDFAERFRRETGRVLLLTAGSDYHGKNKAVLPAMPWML